MKILSLWSEEYRTPGPGLQCNFYWLIGVLFTGGNAQTKFYKALKNSEKKNNNIKYSTIAKLAAFVKREQTVENDQLAINGN